MDSSSSSSIYSLVALSVSQMPCQLQHPASATRSMLTFKLLPRCRPRDEQKCHRVTTDKQCLSFIFIPLFTGQKKSGKVH